MSTLRKKILQAWAGISEDRIFLSILSGISFFYSAGVSIRNLFYDTGIFKVRRLGCPVISIGNITAGGTGKTPTAIMVAGLLQRHGFKPAVLSRGYGGTRKGINVVSDGRSILSNPEEAGDEPFLIARTLANVPVVTNPDRFAAGTLALATLGIDIIVLDDGFQHRPLYRDINIALLDSERPFGNGCLIPRGSLREMPSSLSRADLIILTRSGPAAEESEQRLKDAFPGKAVMRARHEADCVVQVGSGDTHPLSFIAGKKIAAFCGIAQPGSFRELILKAGGDIVFFKEYEDHQKYGLADVNYLKQQAGRASAQAIITTEKDSIKLENMDFPGLFALRIAVKVENPEFPEWLLSRLAK